MSDGEMPTIYCQVCEKILAFDSEFERDEKLTTWTLHTYSNKDGEVRILTCPACEGISVDAVMNCHRERVSRGRDMNYH